MCIGNFTKEFSRGGVNMKNLLHILFKVFYGVLWFVFFSVIWIIMGMWVMSPIAFLIMLTVIYYPFLPDIPFCLYSFLMGVVALLWCCYVIGAYNTYGGFSTPLRVLCRICESVVFYSSYVAGGILMNPSLKGFPAEVQMIWQFLRNRNIEWCAVFIPVLGVCYALCSFYLDIRERPEGWPTGHIIKSRTLGEVDGSDYLIFKGKN